MIEAYYCTPARDDTAYYASGSRRFHNYEEFAEWLAAETLKGPVLITRIAGV